VRFEQKYDGVLIKVVSIPGEGLLVSTNGKIDAGEAPLHERQFAYSHSAPDGDLREPVLASRPINLAIGQPSFNDSSRRTFSDLFAEAGGLSLPYEDGHCYAFELLHPDIQTVAPSSKLALVHLMTRRLSGDFSELPLENRFEAACVQPPQVFSFRSFGACREAARLLPWDNEGFVIVDGLGSRTKVKSEAYMAIQRLLVGDSSAEDDDALAVALTLHSASAPLPPGPSALVSSWRQRLEALAKVCMARGAAAQAALTSRPARSARSERASLEAALSGRMSRHVRAVVANAFVDWSVQGRAGHFVDVLLGSLRSSRLNVSDIREALCTI